ncbi:DMT family transporter [Candidatus Woesebacteria bacterium]|nr:DMT family transporter [Candidatus Woesebacteria bacterium]
MNRYRVRAYLELLLVSAIWGIAGVVIKYTLGGFDPLIFLTYRFAISTVLGMGLFAFYGVKIPQNPKILAITLFYGFLTSTVALGLLFLGFDKTTAIDATLISASGPIFVAAAGAIFLKEHVTSREKIGITIAFLGTAITILEPILKNHDGFAGFEGNLLVFGSLLIGVVTAVLAKVLLRHEVSPVSAANLSFIVGFFTILPFSLVFHGTSQIISQIARASISFHVGVLFMALISGNLAYTLWHKAQKTIEVGEVGLFSYLYPIFATPLAIIWLKEKITLPFIVGAAIITIGVVIAEYKKKKYNTG